MNAFKIAGAVLIATASLGAQAQVSTESEFRGYSTCIDAAKDEVKGLVTSRDYFIARNSDASQFFINGTAWNDGDRVAVRVACDTSRNGRKLLDLAIDDGRFVLDNGSVTVRVAAN
ncbi:MAG TPA: hypothetical protein VLA56_05105 [Pseudomonadales bacterium]|nr:hypothetical protein [Pseudomonadales bacterium]